LIEERVLIKSFHSTNSNYPVRSRGVTIDRR